MNDTILLTGADGFIGSHCLEHLLVKTQSKIVCVCSWRQDGIPERISESDHFKENSSRVEFITHDLTAPFSPLMMKRLNNIQHIVHFAADSNVDRSILEPAAVIHNNVKTTTTMLELARTVDGLKSFIQISTDEVYGAAHHGYCHKEWDAIIPSNPYSASKACQEAIAISYWRTYGVPVVITNTMNNFGERQHPDKFFPLIIRNILSGARIDVHAVNGVVGSRFYLHARNHADAVLQIIKRSNEIPQYEAPGRTGPFSTIPSRFNIVGENELSNLELVKMIGGILGKTPNYELVDAHSSRPGHDLRYALDGQKAYDWGWVPPVKFEDSLKKTVEWYLENEDWLELPTVVK
jgi:dTDP-glucose 4,6-dehydratase